MLKSASLNGGTSDDLLPSEKHRHSVACGNCSALAMLLHNAKHEHQSIANEIRSRIYPVQHLLTHSGLVVAFRNPTGLT